MAVDPETNRVYVPRNIVEYVYGAPLKKADIDAYLATDLPDEISVYSPEAAGVAA